MGVFHILDRFDLVLVVACTVLAVGSQELRQQRLAGAAAGASLRACAEGRNGASCLPDGGDDGALRDIVAVANPRFVRQGFQVGTCIVQQRIA